MKCWHRLFNLVLVGGVGLSGFALGGEEFGSGTAVQSLVGPAFQPVDDGLESPSHTVGLESPSHTVGVESPSHTVGLENPSRTGRDASVPRYRVFDFESGSEQTIMVALDAGLWTEVAAQEGPFVVEGFPLERDRTVDLELERFFIAGPGARIVLGRRGGKDLAVSFPMERVTLFRGKVSGKSGSDVFLAFSDRFSTGYIDPGQGERRYQISQPGDATGTPRPGRLAVFGSRTASGSILDVPLCGTVSEQWHDTPRPPSPTGGRGSEEGPALGMQQLEIAIETDHEFFALFGDVDAAATYVIELIAQVSHIYMRDVNTRVELTFLRLWETPDDLFNQPDPLWSFRSYWNQNMGEVHRDVAHLFSGRRDLPYGGVAYLSALCGDSGYGVDGYMLGEFPSPYKPGAGLYDIGLIAHELGHNCGTMHTPDYGPPIDQCYPPPTLYQRGTLMSYCSQTVSGGHAMWDWRFHARVQLVMEEFIFGAECIADDCNGNGMADFHDIFLGTSADINDNGVPDECEDCNGNGALDDADIAGGTSLDVNSNGIPDECEPDCNDNYLPDDLDLLFGISEDLYGNNVPDECEADCDGDGISDYTEIQADLTLDINRDQRLDACEDCDGDGITDAQALAGAHNAWIGTDRHNVVGEYHAGSGVLVKYSDAEHVHLPMDVLALPSGRVLVSAAENNRVVEFDASSGAYVGDLVPSGSGGLFFPAGLAIRPQGTLLVSSRGTDSVLEYDGGTGAFLGEFVASGSGGLSAPFGLVYGPNGNLFVAGGDNQVREYDGQSGAFIRIFVSAGNNGGLQSPRGLTFIPNGNLLVAGYVSEAVHEYDGQTGAWIGPGVFENGGTLYGPWGLRVGPSGTVFVTRDYEMGRSDDPCEPACLHVTTTRLYEYDPRNGNLLRSYVLGDDTELWSPTGFDFLWGWDVDCNYNLIPDNCDIESGGSEDLNGNGTPDECEVDCNGNGVYDRLDIIPRGTSRDCDLDGVPDECRPDCNNNGTPDPCDAMGAGDFDGSGKINLADFAAFVECFAGPNETPNPTAPECVDACLAVFDFDSDADVDMADFGRLMVVFGPEP